MTPIIKICLYILGIATLAFQLIVSSFQSLLLTPVSIEVYILADFTGFLVVAVAATFSFLFFGQRFIRKLAASKAVAHLSLLHNHEALHDRDRQMSKAVKWIQGSSLTESCFIASLILASRDQPFFLSPFGFGLIYGLVMYGITLSSICHAVAFRPFSSSYVRLTIVPRQTDLQGSSRETITLTEKIGSPKPNLGVPAE